MARNFGDMSEGGGGNFPPAGKHLCRVVKAVPWTSPNKKTPAAKLTLATRDGEYSFDDALFVTAKALWRLVLVARRLCGMPADTKAPDDNLEAAKFLARYIVDNATGKDALITIEEKNETYIATEGPDQGQKKTVARRRVSASGYETPPAEVHQAVRQRYDEDFPTPADSGGGGDIPF